LVAVAAVAQGRFQVLVALVVLVLSFLDIQMHAQFQ